MEITRLLDKAVGKRENKVQAYIERILIHNQTTRLVNKSAEDEQNSYHDTLWPILEFRESALASYVIALDRCMNTLYQTERRTIYGINNFAVSWALSRFSSFLYMRTIRRIYF